MGATLAHYAALVRAGMSYHRAMRIACNGRDYRAGILTESEFVRTYRDLVAAHDPYETHEWLVF